ncbi:hypothetical protein FB451DRAFT_1238207 [Mycena latifolia]|nr:hypothetical protein FB451DRAFT_1238207 [Mycena latifolia]
MPHMRSGGVCSLDIHRARYVRPLSHSPAISRAPLAIAGGNLEQECSAASLTPSPAIPEGGAGTDVDLHIGAPARVPALLTPGSSLRGVCISLRGSTVRFMYLAPILRDRGFGARSALRYDPRLHSGLFGEEERACGGTRGGVPQGRVGGRRAAVATAVHTRAELSREMARCGEALLAAGGVTRLPATYTPLHRSCPSPDCALLGHAQDSVLESFYDRDISAPLGASVLCFHYFDRGGSHPHGGSSGERRGVRVRAGPHFLLRVGRQLLYRGVHARAWPSRNAGHRTPGGAPRDRVRR